MASKPEHGGEDVGAPEALVIDPNRGALARSLAAIEEVGLVARGAPNTGAAMEHLDEGTLVVVLSVVDQAQPELTTHALSTWRPPRPALLALFPRGTDPIELEAEAERLGATTALCRPVPGRALGALAAALAGKIRSERECAAVRRALEACRTSSTPIDPHTQLYRFEVFKPMLVSEIKRARRYGIPLTLLRIAFDRLAEIATEHGPELAHTLVGGLRLAVARALRDQDFAVDIGPEEILALLPHTDVRGARTVAERIRRRVSKTRLTLIDGALGTTCSVGLAVYPGRGEISFAQLVREVSEALAIAQKGGGNRAAQVPGRRRRRTPTR